jgi:peptidoglycan/LPS O-acetylase OafA/YrhL
VDACREWTAPRWRWLGSVGLALVCVSRVWPPAGSVIEPAAFALVVLWLALGLPCLGNAARFGDLSYAVYLVHWPVLQCLVQVGTFSSPWLGLASAVACVLAAAFLLWHVVEKTFLRRDSYYLDAERRGGVPTCAPSGRLT